MFPLLVREILTIFLELMNRVTRNLTIPLLDGSSACLRHKFSLAYTFLLSFLFITQYTLWTNLGLYIDIFSILRSFFVSITDGKPKVSGI